MRFSYSTVDEKLVLCRVVRPDGYILFETREA